MRYPIVQDGGRRWIPLKLLAEELRLHHRHLTKAARLTTPTRLRQLKVASSPRARQALAVEAHMLPFILFAAKPRGDIARLQDFRDYGFQMVAQELMRAAPGEHTAQALLQATTEMLEAEQQRRRELEQSLATVHRNPSALMNARRIEKAGCLTEINWRRVVELANGGHTEDQIAAETKIRVKLVRRFLTGTYETAAALAARSGLKALRQPRPYSRSSPSHQQAHEQSSRRCERAPAQMESLGHT